MTARAKLVCLSVAVIVLIAMFLFLHIGDNWGYILPRRSLKLLTIALTGACIAFSTVVFQTVSNNRILTPNIIGLDALYMLAQTLVVFAFGSTSRALVNQNLNFAVTVGLMVLFSGVLYKVLFKREGNTVHFLLLIGIIFGTLFGTLTTFMQLMIDPNEFLVLQGKMFASYNNVHSELLAASGLAVLAVAAYYAKFAKYMDVLALGKEHAINLGVPYDHVVKRLLIVIAVLISVSTALVGSITFLGLLVANVTYQVMKTHRHTYLIPGSMLIGIAALAGGQLLAERIFEFSTPLSVIINLIGGLYFLYLLLRENKS